MIFLQKEKKLNFLWFHKKFNPSCTITRPEIYHEFKIHLSTLTRGLNAHKYGTLQIVVGISKIFFCVKFWIYSILGEIDVHTQFYMSVMD